MGLKKYVAFSLLLIVAVYIFVFSIQTANYTINVLEYSLELPIAVWIILPLCVLFLATILHIVFYGFKNYLETNSMKKDEDNILEFLKEVLLENNSNKKFKQASLKELSNILSQVRITPKNEIVSSSNNEINTILNSIVKIQKGEYVGDKSIKFNANGTIAHKNLLNRVSSDVDYAIDVLKKRENFSQDILKAAFINLVNNKSMTTIKKLIDGVKFDKDMVLKLIEKDSENSEFAIEHDVIAKYAKDVNFDKNDYIELASSYKKSVQPDELIAMFEKISNENDIAMDAYLNILFEYEMIDVAREILTSSGDDEYQAYRALLELKDSGKHYTLESLCYIK